MSSKKIPLICSGHSRPVQEVSYSAITDDGFFMVSACLDGKPMLRNGVTGDWLGTFVGHKGAVWSAHIDSSALRVVTGSADYTAKLWDALTGEELHSFEHQKIVKSVHFSKDGNRVLTGGLDKILRIFDLERPTEKPSLMEGHQQSIKSAKWCNDGHTVISGGDNELRIWDSRTLKQVGTRPHSSPVTSVEICLDGNHIITTCGKEIHFWKSDLTPVKSFTLGIDVNTASLAPDTSVFVVGGTSDSWSHVYEFPTGKEIEVNKGHHGPVHCVAFAPDGEAYASGSEDGTIRLYQRGEPRNYGLWQDTKLT